MYHVHSTDWTGTVVGVGMGETATMQPVEMVQVKWDASVNIPYIWWYPAADLDYYTRPAADDSSTRPVAYDPDCPACLRGRFHTPAEHEAGLRRARS